MSFKTQVKQGILGQMKDQLDPFYFTYGAVRCLESHTHTQHLVFQHLEIVKTLYLLNLSIQHNIALPTVLDDYPLNLM